MDSRGQSIDEPFWPACSVSFCPALCFHCPSRPPRRRWLMPSLCHRKSLTESCTHWRTSVSSAGGDDFGPSCTGRLRCATSPVCCWGERPGICTLLESGDGMKRWSSVCLHTRNVWKWLWMWKCKCDRTTENKLLLNEMFVFNYPPWIKF